MSADEPSRGVWLGRWLARGGTRAPTRLARLRRIPGLGDLVRGLSRLSEAGTAGYPSDVKRRLKILNLIAFLIGVTTFAYALQQWLIDPVVYRPVIVINLALVATMALVPLAHRLSDIAGGLMIVASEYVALLGFVSFFGREGGGQLQYVIAAAAPFVVFGLGRMRLIAAIVLAGLALHIYVWFHFPPEKAHFTSDRSVIDSLYIQGAVTTFGLIAASVYYAFRLVERAKAETESLLRNILPDSVVDRLKTTPGTAVADSFEEATVLFCDISGFVPLARKLGAAETVRLLNRMVSSFDALATRHGVEKIKTIGDAYMAVAGVPGRCGDCPERAARLALDMLAAVERLRSETGLDIAVRIGLATGPVMAGVIGTHKFSYDVWGDAVNMAARLENLSAPGRIHVCPDCGRRLEKSFVVTSRGTIDIKGLGPRETWYLEGTRG